MTYLGIDIGGTKCAVCLGDTSGAILGKRQFLTEEPKGPQQALDRFVVEAHELIAEHNVEIRAIGISCGSPLDPDTGIVQAPAQLPSWQNVPVVSFFQKHFGVPTFLDNDANAGALAEHEFGAGRGCQHMAFITFGTGLGAGLILNGRIYRGANCYAGEIGHMRLADDGPVGCRKLGSFEGFCSGAGIAQIAERERILWNGTTAVLEGADTKSIASAAIDGDAFALHVFQVSGTRLGQGLALVNDVLNLEKIIIGSIFLRCEALLRPAMEKVLYAEALSASVEKLQIVPTGLGEAVGDYAAIAVAASRMKYIS